MSTQDYRHHVRFYTAHHFIFYPILGFLICFSSWKAWQSGKLSSEWVMIAALSLMLAFLSLMMRQHYALGLQDRVVRLEMRLRYFQLTGERLEQYEAELGSGRIAALRFASDTQLPELMKRALSEKLSADHIKRAVTAWQADHDRV